VVTQFSNPRRTIEDLWDRACPVAPLLDAFEREIREQIAQQLYDQNPDRDADFSAGVDWAIDTIRSPR